MCSARVAINDMATIDWVTGKVTDKDAGVGWLLDRPGPVQAQQKA